jgi:hypothetical protein
MPLVATLPLELSNAILSKCWDKTVAPICRDDLCTYFNVELRDYKRPINCKVMEVVVVCFKAGPGTCPD